LRAVPAGCSAASRIFICRTYARNLYPALSHGREEIGCGAPGRHPLIVGIGSASALCRFSPVARVSAFSRTRTFTSSPSRSWALRFFPRRRSFDSPPGAQNSWWALYRALIWAGKCPHSGFIMCCGCMIQSLRFVGRPTGPPVGPQSRSKSAGHHQHLLADSNNEDKAWTGASPTYMSGTGAQLGL
jgi:hypothetical protein